MSSCLTITWLWWTQPRGHLNSAQAHFLLACHLIPVNKLYRCYQKGMKHPVIRASSSPVRRCRTLDFSVWSWFLPPSLSIRNIFHTADQRYAWTVSIDDGLPVLSLVSVSHEPWNQFFLSVPRCRLVHSYQKIVALCTFALWFVQNVQPWPKLYSDLSNY